MLIGVVAEQLLPGLADTAIIVEAISATDAAATGNVVFAMLVDDPAAVDETVDAYLGEIMIETASVDATVDAGLVYIATVDEPAAVVAAEDGAVPTIYTDAVAESASASDVPSATVGVGAAVTTTSAIVAGPLLVFDTTFPSSSLTVIDVGR